MQISTYSLHANFAFLDISFINKQLTKNDFFLFRSRLKKIVLIKISSVCPLIDDKQMYMNFLLSWLTFSCLIDFK